MRQYLVKKWRLWKLKSDKPYDDEFTVFINVNIDNLNEVSKFIPLILKKVKRVKRDIIKITTVRKYLLISLKSKFIFVKINLFMKIFFGLLKDKIWFKEYLNKE